MRLDNFLRRATECVGGSYVAHAAMDKFLQFVSAADPNCTIGFE
jgi:hypothetical protein